MEERNIIKWSEYSGYTKLTIPSGKIWMSESELVDLFGVLYLRLFVNNLQRVIIFTVVAKSYGCNSATILSLPIRASTHLPR